MSNQSVGVSDLVRLFDRNNVFGGYSQQFQVSYDDLNCVVDDTLPASSSDNYIDCQSKEMVAAGRDKCCKIEGSVGCCEPGGRWKKILAMSLGIGLTFITLAVIYIYLFWCKKDTIPCLGRCQDRIQKKYHQAEESLPCCASRVERRKQEQEIMRIKLRRHIHTHR
ncbi:unnamed protein product [Mytilus edulis]|uniref:Uncharacterized protein n=1 Tax=Mytilus edulis TaxID=6550 RepID=A0A8S3PU61_MYTED|nr:unnamed protein product [Mytilus edulis]